MNIELLLASDEHLPHILPLVRQYHEFENLETTEEHRQLAVQTLLSNRNLGGIWLIYADQTLCGYIALCKGFSIEFGGYDAFVDEFYLLPEFRGKGFGTQTLEKIKKEAQKMEIRALHLEVARTNQKARKLYSQAQFKAREKYILQSYTFSSNN